MTLKKFFDIMMGREDNDVNEVFENNKTSISAREAYLLSRYGRVKTDKQLIETFFTSVKNLIESKNTEHSYCGMVEIDDDIIKFLPKIKDRLIRELGYKVIILNDNSIITDSETGMQSRLSPGSTYLLIIWNRQAIEDVSTFNAENCPDSVESVHSVELTDVVDSNEEHLPLKPIFDKENAKPLNS